MKNHLVSIMGFTVASLIFVILLQSMMIRGLRYKLADCESTMMSLLPHVELTP